MTAASQNFLPAVFTSIKKRAKISHFFLGVIFWYSVVCFNFFVPGTGFLVSGHLFKKRKSQWNQFHFKLKSSHWWMKCRIQSFPTKIEYSRIESFYKHSPQLHFWAKTWKANGPVISISDVPFRYSCGLFINTHQVAFFLMQVNKIGQNFQGIIIFISVVEQDRGSTSNVSCLCVFVVILFLTYLSTH